MQKTKHLLALFFLMSPAFLWAQTKNHFSISGAIKDKATGETLPGATVSFLQLPGVGVSANSYGFYSVSIPEGSYTLVATYTGYRTDTLHIDLKDNLQHNINLEAASSQLKEVKITSSSSRSGNVLTTPPGVQKLTVN